MVLKSPLMQWVRRVSVILQQWVGGNKCNAGDWRLDCREHDLMH